jgi:hypothetical protein
LPNKKKSSIQSRNRNRGIQNERDLAEDFNDLGILATRVPLSGAVPLPGMPRGDVFSAEISAVWEAKVIGTKVQIREKRTTAARYVQIDLHWLDKIDAEAKKSKMRHAAVIFRGMNLKRRYVLLGFEEYVSLLKLLP